MLAVLYMYNSVLPHQPYEPKGDNGYITLINDATRDYCHCICLFDTVYDFLSLYICISSLSLHYEFYVIYYQLILCVINNGYIYHPKHMYHFHMYTYLLALVPYFFR